MPGTKAPGLVAKPLIIPLGDSALLVRFGATLTDGANGAAIAFARQLEREPVAGVLEVMPNLVSVLLRYDPRHTALASLAGELRLLLSRPVSDESDAQHWTIPVTFDGPDLDAVADTLGLSPAAFIAAHNSAPLRVMATGFAPGFVYCGLHADLVLPRREAVRARVPAGSVLFAAGQTAIAATDMPTGWHVIGRTDFRNFRGDVDPPTRLGAGDAISFTVAP